MAAAYASFASGGIYAKPRAITRVAFPDGKVDTSWSKPQTKRVLSSGVAWKVNDILEQNALYGTGYGSSDGIHPNAGKTGTTEDHADGWFDGYTRDFSTAVWMGYPQGEIPMLDVHGYEVAGATFAVPIWHKFMAVAEAKLPPRKFLVPAHFPVLHAITPGDYGYLAAPSTSTTTTTTPAGKSAKTAPAKASLKRPVP
jgi:membrane peptidoglycan carboxypeptidase